MQLPLTLVASSMVLPSQCVTSAMLDKRLQKPTGYVQKHSGVIQRYHATPEDSQSKLACQALLQVCADKGMGAEDIDLLISVSAVPEQAIPSTASKILAHTGWDTHVAGYDINASCIGVIPALLHASSLLNQGVYQRIAIVASDLASRGLNWNDEESSYIFGDGACALIVEKGDGQSALIGHKMCTYADAHELCQIKAGGTARNPVIGYQESDFYFAMQGLPLFKKTAQHLPKFTDELLQASGLNIDEVDLWIPHQASHLGLKHMSARMGISADKVVNIYANHGNQVSASLPCTMHLARSQGQWTKGQTVVIIGTGAGLSFGALVWRT